MTNKLLMVRDNYSGREAIYVDGTLRADFDDDNPFSTNDLYECHANYIGEDKPALLLYTEIDANELGIFTARDEVVEWPEDVEELNIKAIV